MNASRASNQHKRVAERRQAAALARHYREVERLSVTEIAARLGRQSATVRSYLYDPDASKARALKASYRGSCEGCGVRTSGGDGPGQAKALCPRCRGRVSSTWNRERIEHALRAWRARYGEPALSTDLSRNYAERYGGERLRRLEAGWEGGRWPSLGVVQYHFGTVAKANHAALAG